MSSSQLRVSFEDVRMLLNMFTMYEEQEGCYRIFDKNIKTKQKGDIIESLLPARTHLREEGGKERG
jgi:hypothetical protein